MVMAFQVPQKEDRLGSLARLLGVVQSGQAIYKGFQDTPEEKQAEKASQGIISREKQVDYAKAGGKFSKEPTPGAIEAVDEGTNEKMFITFPQAGIKPPEFKQANYAGKDGKERIGSYDPSTGKVIQNPDDPLAYRAPEKPAKDITVAERNTLQNQFDRDPQVRLNKAVFQSLNDARELIKDPSPASDLSLVYSYMKALDPNSVVRETEAETAQALGGLMQRAQAKLSDIAGEGRLTPEQRQDMLRQIEKKAMSATQSQKQVEAQFSGLAGRRGVESQDLRFSNLPSLEVAGNAPPISKEEALAELERRRKQPATNTAFQQKVTPAQAVQILNSRGSQVGSR
jgi:hypothetical protein